MTDRPAQSAPLCKPWCGTDARNEQPEREVFVQDGRYWCKDECYKGPRTHPAPSAPPERPESPEQPAEKFPPAPTTETAEQARLKERVRRLIEEVIAMEKKERAERAERAAPPERPGETRGHVCNQCLEGFHSFCGGRPSCACASCGPVPAPPADVATERPGEVLADGWERVSPGPVNCTNFAAHEDGFKLAVFNQRDGEEASCADCAVKMGAVVRAQDPVTSAEINALPERVRNWIHALETNCDPAGTVRENVFLRDTLAALELKIAELTASPDDVAGPNESTAAEHYGPDSFGGTDEGSHYDLSAHRPTLPAEQPAPPITAAANIARGLGLGDGPVTSSHVVRPRHAPSCATVRHYSGDVPCDCDGDAQAAPDGGRLSERMRHQCSPRGLLAYEVKAFADEVAALEAKLAAAMSSPMRDAQLAGENGEIVRLREKLAAAERDRDDAKKDAIETIRNAIDVTAKAVEEERARCLAWALNSGQTARTRADAIRDGKPTE